MDTRGTATFNCGNKKLFFSREKERDKEIRLKSQIIPWSRVFFYGADRPSCDEESHRSFCSYAISSTYTFLHSDEPKCFQTREIWLEEIQILLFME